jgi:aryl-alcohol dehydrogenase-like predicted oxidoreductase
VYFKDKIKKRLILGTASFGMDYGATNTSGEVPLKEIKAIIKMCRDNGISELDTAQAYGRAEVELGKTGVRDFLITTKIHLSLDEGAESVKGKLAQSLDRLQVDQVENLLLHNEECLSGDNADQIVQALHHLVEQGVVGKVGLSSYEPKQALDLCQRHGFKITQLPANALDNRLFEGGAIDRFIENKIEVQIRSVFLQGVLLEKPQVKSAVPKDVVNQAEQFRNRCRERGLTPLQGALGHVLQASKHAKIVFGVTRLEEFQGILESLADDTQNLQFLSPAWKPEFDPRNWKC